jgi:hypothetical protein
VCIDGQRASCAVRRASIEDVDFLRVPRARAPPFLIQFSCAFASTPLCRASVLRPPPCALRPLPFALHTTPPAHREARLKQENPHQPPTPPRYPKSQSSGRATCCAPEKKTKKVSLSVLVFSLPAGAQSTNSPHNPPPIKLHVKNMARMAVPHNPHRPAPPSRTRAGSAPAPRAAQRLQIPHPHTAVVARAHEAPAARVERQRAHERLVPDECAQARAGGGGPDLDLAVVRAGDDEVALRGGLVPGFAGERRGEREREGRKRKAHAP